MKKELTHGEKLRLAGIKRFGSEEAWLDSKRVSGAKGGKKSRGGGFAYMKNNDPNRLKQVSDLGRATRWGKQSAKD